MSRIDNVTLAGLQGLAMNGAERRNQQQALTLDLYDDDRAKEMRHQGSGLAWRGLLALLAQHGQRLATDGGAKLRFLVEPSASPLLADLRTRILQRFPRAKVVSYSSVAADGAVDGAQLAFGRPLEPRHNLSAAKVILALDSDFLSDGPEQVRLSRQFAAAREPGPNMNRLYAAEPCPTVTGDTSVYTGGFNAGGGVNFGTRRKFFIDVRYHHMFTADFAREIIPVTFGVRW